MFAEEAFVNDTSGDEAPSVQRKHGYFSLNFLITCVIAGLVVTVGCLLRFVRNIRAYTFLPYVATILIANATFLAISFLMAMQRASRAFPIHDFCCKSLLYVQAIANNVQLPCIAAIAVQLYVTVFSRLGRRLPCTCSKVRSSSGQRFSLTMFVFLASLINVKLMVIAESNDDGLCILGETDDHWLTWISWTNTILFCFAPFIITLVTNVAMLWRLTCVERRLLVRVGTHSRKAGTAKVSGAIVVDLVSSALIPISILVKSTRERASFADKVTAKKTKAHAKRHVDFAVKRLRRKVRRHRRLTTAAVLALLFVVVFLKIPNHLLNLFRLIHADAYETGEIYELVRKSTLEAVNLVCFVSFHLQFIFAPFYVFSSALLREQPAEYL